MLLILAIVVTAALSWVYGYVADLDPGSAVFSGALLSRDNALGLVGILRVALPVFLLVLVVLKGFQQPVATMRGKLNSKVKTAYQPGTPPMPGTGRRTRFPHQSEVLDFNYGLLRCMEWRRFEIVCAEYLRCMGYEVMETGFGAKDAVDLEVFLPGKVTLFNVVKCFSETTPVDEAIVRTFVETMHKRNVVEGMIFSVCGFTPAAQKIAAGHRIALVNGGTLCSRVRSLDSELRAAMIEVANSGDYTTPTCPTCGIKLVLRRKHRAKPGKGEFWGCINYPRCEVTFPFTG